jgi:hypothetical protein
MVAIASSHDAAANDPSDWRISGVVIRSACVSVPAADQPFTHSPPLLTGKCVFGSTTAEWPLAVM